MRLAAMNATKRFIEEYFPHAEIVILAGSAFKGEETDTSDIDLDLFDYSISNSYRESFVL